MNHQSKVEPRQDVRSRQVIESQIANSRRRPSRTPAGVREGGQAEAGELRHVAVLGYN